VSLLRQNTGAKFQLPNPFFSGINLILCDAVTTSDVISRQICIIQKVVIPEMRGDITKIKQTPPFLMLQGLSDKINSFVTHSHLE